MAPTTVFVSSTRQDLIPFREAVSRHLRKAGFAPSEMESFGARDQEPLEACLQEVADADLFVGIYAWRHGFVPREATVSITELELLEAQRRHKPVFCYLIDESLDWPAALRDTGDGARGLEALKRRIREQLVVEPFTSPEGLAASVLAALLRWQERQSTAGLSPERHVQLALLDKVERFWIDGVLRRAVPEGRRLRIRREERPGAVGRPVPEGEPEETGEVVEPIHDFFLRQGRSLLLLGPPGSGKTIALLDLTRGLARVARRDPAAAVPVLFHLASWQKRDGSLAGWMAGELARRYQAGPTAAAEWIARDQILPLLDGLDEVAPEDRPSCVEAINAHLRDHGLATGMAVACHTRVYAELPALLQLETAVALLPLTPAQIDARLGAAGPAFAGLRELAASPLVLILLERTFEKAAPQDLAGGGIDQVFEAYVTHVLEPGRELPWTRETARGSHPPEEARRTLAWLARGLAAHDRALLQIERLQPSWLTSRRQLFAYAVLSRALGGALLGLPPALALGRPELGGAALLAGALVGVLDSARLGRTEPAGRDRVPFGRMPGRALGLGGASCLAVFLLGMTWVETTALVKVSLLLGLLFGVVFGVRGAGRGGNRDVRVAEALVWRAWSWRGTAIGALSLLAFSLASWGLFRLRSDASVSYLDAGFWLPFSLIGSLLGAILFGAFGGLGGRPLEKKERPNQGTWLALRNAGFAGLATGCAALVALGLVLVPLRLGGVLPRGDLWLLPQAAAVLGAWAGLASSGLDFVQHFTLRLVIWRTKLAPLRLVRLLNHAAERGLLQRPGGSYTFFHPLLLEFFAQRDDGAGDGIRTRDQQLGRL